MTDYHWIYYNKKNIHELYEQDEKNIHKLYEQDEKITQQELMNEKQQEQMNQTKIRAQELFDEIITRNPSFNERVIYAHSTMILLPGKRINGFMLYQKVLHEWFWKENKHINIQRERIAVNALLWKILTPEQKQYFGYHAKLLNNQYKSQ